MQEGTEEEKQGEGDDIDDDGDRFVGVPSSPMQLPIGFSFFSEMSVPKPRQRRFWWDSLSMSSIFVES